MRAPVAAVMGLVAALLVATLAFGMPVQQALSAAGYGAAYGLLPIGWIVLNVIFMYQLTLERGQFDVLRNSIAGIVEDSRLQLLLVAFCFGAFFEGAAGFGTPVAVTGAMLIGLGFSPLQAAGLSLIANTAPVAFGALGTPLVTLAGVTDLPLQQLSAVVGRIMTPFAVLVPFWLLVAYCGWRRTIEVWPAVLVAGVSFAAAQLAISNLHGPWLTAIGASLVSIAALVLFLRLWKPRNVMRMEHAASGAARPQGASLRKAWMPWIILMVLVFLWGMPQVKAWLDGIFRLSLAFPGLDQMVQRMPPVVAKPEIEAARYNFNLLSATGTAILISGVLSGIALGAGPVSILRTYFRSLVMVAPSLLTIAAMLALGYLTRYAGVDATLGLAFAATGVLYPFFGTYLGWLGVAVTGSDTASNVLFGGLQKVTSQQLGLSPVLMASANSAGGVMGKMIDAQSIVVASTATRWFGQEGTILRYVFLHSLVLAGLVGLVVMLLAYVPPFTHLVPGG
jgi:lactate permease